MIMLNCTLNKSILGSEIKQPFIGADVSGKADKATTLAGYGIEDAYTKDETNELISAIDTGGTGDVSDIVEAINELEENKVGMYELMKGGK